MRTDICHFFNCPIEKVFSAYAMAVKNEFNNDAQIMPVNTIVFGLKTSWKYNMNGGMCHVHFMRYNGGTAVGIRYTIIQLMGARCKKHDQDLTTLVEKYLGVKAQDLYMDVNVFLNNKETANGASSASTPSSTVAHPAQAPALFCVGCGAKFQDGDLFCRHCGRKRQ